MFLSQRYSFLALRLGLAVVFLWFGIDKFIHPSYWINAWVPVGFISFLSHIHVSAQSFIFLNGIFEILVGISLLTQIFIKIFSILAIIFLLGVLVAVGLNEITIRDLTMIGALVSVVLWQPARGSKSIIF